VKPMTLAIIAVAVYFLFIKGKTGTVGSQRAAPGGNADASLLNTAIEVGGAAVKSGMETIGIQAD